jgi:hypothetical protein
MPLNPVEMLYEHFAALPAPRQLRCDDHPLLHRLFIAFCAVLCGTEHFTAMTVFGQATAS